MQYGLLGRSGLNVSEIGLGCGVTGATFVQGDEAAQQALAERALELGINLFDTAPLYGDGRSEVALGRSLRALGATPYVTTKVGLTPADLEDPTVAVRRSLEQSLERLGLAAVDVLTLHNRIDHVRDDRERAVSADDVARGAIRDALAAVKESGLARFVGITGLGRPDALRQVIEQGGFDTCQVQVNILNPSAVQPAPVGFRLRDFGQLADVAANGGTGVLAIRVLAGGAFCPAPSTPPDPTRSVEAGSPQRSAMALELEADRVRAQGLAPVGPDGRTPAQTAVRFALSFPSVSSALLGITTLEQLEEAVACADGRGLDAGELERITEYYRSIHM
jgi:aryl-alcohol dehydrogenase-like predicted oxidoreductase